MIACPRCGEQNADGARFCSNCGNALGAAAPPISEVRKTVTVMFMDAVGSTALGEQSDPESLRRVMTRYFDEIRMIVERHGGTIEKYIGDAVMAVFGVPVAHEDDALRAVRAAIEIRARLAVVGDELQRQRGTNISWRTGINTGEVVAGDAGAGQRFVSGDAVNVAARLEQSAQADEILLGSETYGLVRDAVTAEAAEPVLAKGKSEPLTVYRLIDMASGGSAPARRLDSPMIGRHRQRRQLNEAFEQAVDERVCHLFTILGAAGVGKSRLVGEFLGGLGTDAQILHGRCLSYGEGITYWPIAEAIRGAAGLAEEDDDETVRRKIGALVDDERDRSLVVERIGQLFGRFGSSGAAEETFWAVRTLLASLALSRPVVLVLDDIHWAEPTLLDLIEQLVDWIRDAPVLLLCVARQDLLEARPDWGGGKNYATTITLEPLSQTESQELMVNLLGQVELGAELVEKIGSSAEGNPLFVEEMIAMLIDTGYLERRNGGWAAVDGLAEVAVPPTIQALLAARLDGLPTSERAVIERGAVEGKVFHRSAVAELAPADMRDSVPMHLRALSRKELVRPDRTDFYGDEAFRFRHLLIRDAAYAAMPKEARADLHARFAQWLERVTADHGTEYEEILGYHLERAYRYRLELGSLDDDSRRLGERAAEYLGASGQRALKRGDIHAAIKLLTGAVSLVPADSGTRYPLLADLGIALTHSGELRRADNLLTQAIAEAEVAGDVLGKAHVEVARLGSATTMNELPIGEIIGKSQELLAIFEEHGDDSGAIRATFELGRHNFFAGKSQRAFEILSDRIKRYPSNEAPAQLLTPLMMAMFWGPMPVPEVIRHFGAIDTSGSRMLEAIALRIQGGLRALVGDFDAGRQLIRRTIEIENELGRRVLANSAAGHFLGPLEMLAGNYAEAEGVLLGAFRAMSELGDRAFSSTVAGYLAHLYVELDRFDEAERYARITLETSQPDDAEAQAQGHMAMARVLAARAEYEAAEETARRAVAIAEGTDYLTRRGETWASLSEVLMAAGRSAEARDALRRALENFDAKGATAFADRVRQRLAQIES